MNETLEDLASTIHGAHEAVDELIDAVGRHDGDPARWYVGTSNESPDADETDDYSPFTVVETDDPASAKYVVRELLQRGLEPENYEDEVEGRFVYVYRPNSDE